MPTVTGGSSDATMDDVEAPTRFLEPRWVMLTAGMRLKGSVQAQRALVAELDAAGISALGFGVEEETGQRDVVAADVHQPAASCLRLVADVPGIIIEV